MKSWRIEAPATEFINRRTEELGGRGGERASCRLVLGHFEPQTAIGGLGSQKPA